MDRQSEALFHELADLSAEQREEYMRGRNIPAAVRAEVEELLRYDSSQNHELTHSIAACAEQVLENGQSIGRCGPYQLERVLGRGGMGAVFLGQRADGEVDQRVAVKLLHHAGEGPSFQDRFLRERQILASLNHPGIARLLDAGHTSDGQPYLAMEYIQGIPIDQYSERLDVRAKLRLFIKVCEAVSHAHSRLILHRDLKPSNILVDESGEPKLLDFGIAKILDSTGSQTRTIERRLTPDYASPEQIRGGEQSIPSDIYSLGVVLYKILTREFPRTRTSPDGKEETAASEEMRAPSRLDSTVPQDLDYIVRKALRQEPEERYRSAEALAEDLRAVLESRPVRARSGNAWYRGRKFVRRYWVAVAAAVAVIVSLSAGLYVANRERAIAQRRFTEVRQLARKFIQMDNEIRDLPGTTKARQRIVATALEYLSALTPEARKDRELALEIADAYRQVANVQGVPIHSNLGQSRDAQASLRRAEAEIDPVLAAEPANRKALLESAEIAHDRMAIASVERRVPEAMEQAHKAEQQLDRLARLNVPREDIPMMTRIYANAAIAYSNAHYFEDAVRAARRGLEISRDVPAARPYRSLAIGSLASALRWTGDLDGALAAIQESLKMLESTANPGVAYRMNLIEHLSREGRILGEDWEISMGRPVEAVAVLQKSLDLAEQMAVQDPHDSSSRQRVALAAEAIGDILRHTDPQRAETYYSQALQRTREITNNVEARRNEASILSGSSYALRGLHRDAEAAQRIGMAFALLRETHDYPADRIVAIDAAHTVVRALADQYAASGRLAEAAQTYRDLLDKVMASNPNVENDLRNATYVSNDELELARTLRRAGRTAEAISVEERRQALWRHWANSLPNNPFVLRQMRLQ